MSITKLSHWIKLISALALICSGAANAPATTYTWTGKAPSPNDDLWSNMQNWSPSNNVPGAGDTAIIGNPATGAGAGAIIVDSTVTVANLTMVTSILNVTGSLTVSSSFESDYNTFFGSGSIVVNGSMTMDLVSFNQNATTVNCSLTLNGATTVKSNAVMNIGSNISVVNNGTFTLANAASVNTLNVSGAVFVNQGTFSGGNSTVSMTDNLFSNAPAGIVTAASGCKLQIHGTLASRGAFSPAANSIVYVDADTALHGGAQFTAAGLTELTGTTTVDGQVSDSGKVQLADPLAALPSLTLGGVFRVLGGGALTWLGGSIQTATNITGTLQIDTGGTMLINQIASLGVRGIILTNSGTINCTNQGTINIGYYAEIDNAGSFNLWNDGAWIPYSSGPVGYNIATFNNYGTLAKRFGATNGVAQIGIPVNSATQSKGGIIESDVGALQLTGGGVVGTLKGTGQIRLTNHSWLVSPNGGTQGSLINPYVILNGTTVLSLSNVFTMNGGVVELDPGATIAGNSTFMNTAGTFIWAGGAIALGATTTFMNGLSGFVTLSGNIKFFRSGIFRNGGTLNWVGDNSVGGIYAYDGVVFINSARGTWNCKCDAGIFDYSTNTPPVFTNRVNGTINKRLSTGRTTFDLPFVNQGILQIESGTLEIAYYDDSGNPSTGEVQLQSGKLEVDTVVTFHGIITGSGQITGHQGLTVAGVLEGDQISVASDLTNDGKTTAGDAPGIISYASNNNYYQTTNGLLVIPIRGTNAATPDFGQLKLGSLGQVTLAGTLEADITEGYAPPIGATFLIISSYQRNGTFTRLALPPGLQLNYTVGGATLVVTGTVPVGIISPPATNGQFQFGFNTISNRSYTVQSRTNLAAGTWSFFTNFNGDGSYWQFSVPSTNTQRYFRVSNP